MAALRAYTLRPQLGYFADADYAKSMAISPRRSPRGEGGAATKPDESAARSRKTLQSQLGVNYDVNSARNTWPSSGRWVFQRNRFLRADPNAHMEVLLIAHATFSRGQPMLGHCHRTAKRISVDKSVG